MKLAVVTPTPEVACFNALIEFIAAVEALLATIGGFRGRLEWAGGGPEVRQKLINILGELEGA